MATGVIANRSVAAMKSGEKADYLWDEEVAGFGLKITPAGSKVYVFDFRMGGRSAPKQRITIGRHGAWTPTEARAEAKRLRRMVDTGVDPRAAEMQRQNDHLTLEVGAVIERFIAEYLTERWKGGAELAAGILRRRVVPAWRGRNVKSLGRSDIAVLMSSLNATPALRRNCFAVVRRMFRWAVDQGLLDSSPVRDIEPPPAPVSRDRVLTDVEIVRVWSGASRLGYPFEPFFKVLLLTGQRREEVAGMTWRELDRDSRLWTIPAARTKNGVLSDIPLSTAAIQVLDDVAGLREGASDTWPTSGFVFSTNGRTSVSGFSRAKRRLDAILDGAETPDTQVPGHGGLKPLDPWRIHDLRRTVATGLQRLGVRLEVTETVLNHISGSRSGIAGVYQRHDFRDEKRDALDRWSAHVAALVAG